MGKYILLNLVVFNTGFRDPFGWFKRSVVKNTEIKAGKTFS